MSDCFPQHRQELSPSQRAIKPHNRVRLGMAQVVYPFTPADDALMTELRILGMGTTEIAKFVSAASGIKRTQASINMRLKSLAKRDDEA